MLRRRWRWLVVVLMAFLVLAGLAWMESQRMISGWLRGETFYHGRPASYWRSVVAQPGPIIPIQILDERAGVARVVWITSPSGERTWWHRIFDRIGASACYQPTSFPYSPKAIFDDALDPVLAELETHEDCNHIVPAWIETRQEIKNARALQAQ